MKKYKIPHFGIFEETELDSEIIAIYEENLDELYPHGKLFEKI